MSRRRLLGLLAGAAVPVGALATAGYGYWVEPHWVAVRRHTVWLRGLPAAFDGFRLVHLADVHYHEEVVPVAFLARVMALVNAQRPDAVTVTGDFVSNDVGAYGAAAARLLSRLQATHGVYGVMGNHDYAVYGAGGDLQAAARRSLHHPASERFCDALRAGGMTLLRNQAQVIARGSGRLMVVGLDDLWAGRFDPKAAFSTCGTGGLRLVLLHNPDAISRLPRLEEALILCGHTHGGVVKLPLLGRLRPSVEDPTHVYGMVSSGARQVYVTSGVGYNRRFRFGVRPEIAVLTLKRNTANSQQPPAIGSSHA